MQYIQKCLSTRSVKLILDPHFSLTIYNSASSPLTLKIMLGVVLVFVPLVLLYQAWVYKTFSHRLSRKDLDYEEAY